MTPCVLPRPVRSRSPSTLASAAVCGESRSRSITRPRAATESPSTVSTRTRSSRPLGGTATMRTTNVSPPAGSTRGLTTHVPPSVSAPSVANAALAARRTRSASRVRPGAGPVSAT